MSVKKITKQEIKKFEDELKCEELCVLDKKEKVKEKRCTCFFE